MGVKLDLSPYWKGMDLVC